MLGPDRNVIKKRNELEEQKRIQQEMLEKSKKSGKEMMVYKTSIGDLMATPGALIELKV